MHEKHANVFILAVKGVFIQQGEYHVIQKNGYLLHTVAYEVRLPCLRIDNLLLYTYNSIHCMHHMDLLSHIPVLCPVKRNES